ncbi:Tubulin-folding cofactor C [Psilocybe cubensis]|nr:Tubulin-folding cofactor C [Psilocybe cubensis]KAH9481509.1 Tubulin-folding cofactor C [Psilocybe cubensis]
MRYDLESQISAAKTTSPLPQETLQDLAVSLAKAAKALADATGSLPSYDQKQYETQLKALEKSVEELRISNAPKSKFAFKRKPKAADSAPAPPLSPAPVTTPVDPKQSVTVLPTPTHLVLSSKSHQYITRASLPEHPQQTDLALSDLDNCVVNLLPPIPSISDGRTESLILTALHARNLTNCIILLPSIEGSALLHDMSNCILVLGSHQFRMHSSKKIDIFLAISSNPIIEHCNAIRFSRYPSTLMPALLGKKESPPFTVQDFSHIRPTPSPNFSTMDDSTKQAIEDGIASAHNDTTFVEKLNTVLPQ